MREALARVEPRLQTQRRSTVQTTTATSICTSPDPRLVAEPRKAASQVSAARVDRGPNRGAAGLLQRSPSNGAVGRYGITLPNRATAVDRIDAKRLAKLRRDGLRVVDIAERLGCSKRTVERAIQNDGIRRLVLTSRR
jgi:hypothetical protein